MKQSRRGFLFGALGTGSAVAVAASSGKAQQLDGPLSVKARYVGVYTRSGPQLRRREFGKASQRQSGSQFLSGLGRSSDRRHSPGAIDRPGEELDLAAAGDGFFWWRVCWTWARISCGWDDAAF